MPHAAAPDAPPLRIGILGAARIARKFADGVRGSSMVHVSAVASRDTARAQAFVDATGVPTVFPTYESLLASDSIDAIYNPLPNGLHAEWSIRAMDAGKHVLCEKPLATSHADATAMFAASRRSGVRLVEGYPYRAQQQTLHLQRLLDEGVIGRVRMVWASFAFTLTDRSDIRFVPALGGGALMDLGSYPLSFIRMIAGEAPTALQALGDWDRAGVDTAAVANLQFANGIIAQASCSFDAAVHRQALIAGTDGVIETSYSNHTSPEMPAVLLLRRGQERRDPPERIELPNMNGFRGEAEAFAAHVRGAPWTGISEAESLDVAAMLDALRAQIAATAGPVV